MHPTFRRIPLRVVSLLMLFFLPSLHASIVVPAPHGAFRPVSIRAPYLEDRLNVNLDLDVAVLGRFDAAAFFAPHGLNVVSFSDSPLGAALVTRSYEVTLGEGHTLGRAYQSLRRLPEEVQPGVRVVSVREVGLTWATVVSPDMPVYVLRTWNFSTRARVGSGDDVSIGGLVVPGDFPRFVTIRVLGPTLTEAGVPGALSDPVVALFAGSRQIVTNDNWGDQPAFWRMTAHNGQYAQLQEKECAIRTLLDPGVYSAVVSGKNGATGVALIEFWVEDNMRLDPPVILQTSAPPSS